MRFVVLLALSLGLPGLGHANGSVITPAQERVLGAMLGYGDEAFGGCMLRALHIEQTMASATYDCAEQTSFVVELHHPSAALPAIVETDKFKVVAHTPRPPAALLAALEAAIRAKEGRFAWSVPSPSRGGNGEDATLEANPRRFEALWPLLPARPCLSSAAQAQYDRATELLATRRPQEAYPLFVGLAWRGVSEAFAGLDLALGAAAPNPGRLNELRGDANDGLALSHFVLAATLLHSIERGRSGPGSPNDKYREVIAHLRACLPELASVARVWAYLALAEARLQEGEAAAVDAARAVALGPLDPEAYIARAEARYRCQPFEAAVDVGTALDLATKQGQAEGIATERLTLLRSAKEALEARPSGVPPNDMSNPFLPASLRTARRMAGTTLGVIIGAAVVALGTLGALARSRRARRERAPVALPPRPAPRDPGEGTGAA